MTLSPSCPRCGSADVVSHHYARKTCSTVGGVAGAGASLAAAWEGASSGIAAGRFAGPAGVVFGGITGALVGVLLGGAAGSSAGAVLGNAIDEHVLDNHECQSCGHRFSLQDAMAALEPVACDSTAPSASPSNRSVPLQDFLRSTFKSDHPKE